MRVGISPVVVDGQRCVEAEVSVAVSNSVAVRAVPVDADGVEHPDGVLTVVGASEPDIVAFMGTVAAALESLLAGRS